jgi:hypothetical protein
VTVRPAAVLTIENFASFNRQVREVDDGALVVYTGGFPSAGVIDMLTGLLNAVDPDVPFFHWGDIDPGGVRIFRLLEESLPRSPLPHLMDRLLAEAHGKPAAPDRTLAAIAATSSAISDLADWLAHGDTIWHLEQEALDPAAAVPNV